MQPFSVYYLPRIPPFAGAAEPEKKEDPQTQQQHLRRPAPFIMLSYGLSYVDIKTQKERPFLEGVSYTHVTVALINRESYFRIGFSEEDSERDLGEDTITISGVDIEGNNHAKDYIATLALGKNLLRREMEYGRLELFVQVEGGIDLETKYLETAKEKEEIPHNPDLDFLYGLGLMGLTSTTFSRAPIGDWVNHVPYLGDLEMGFISEINLRRVNITRLNPINGGNTAIVGTLSFFIAR